MRESFIILLIICLTLFAFDTLSDNIDQSVYVYQVPITAESDVNCSACHQQIIAEFRISATGEITHQLIDNTEHTTEKVYEVGWQSKTISLDTDADNLLFEVGWRHSIPI